MEHRTLGSSDLDVSVIGLGTNNFGNRISDHADSARVVHQCLDEGINFIDTADMYGGGESEVHIGAALKGRRNEAIIASKYNISKLEGKTIREHLTERVDTALTKLQTDHIDLYQIHFPGNGVSQEEIIEPLSDMVEAGKLRYIGECNYSGWRHAQADHVSEHQGWARMVSSQNYYNVFRRQVELELLPYCTDANVGFLPYFPLAGGWLTGKYKRGDTPAAGARRKVGELKGDEAAWDTLDKLDAFANEHGHTILDLAFAWLLAHKAVSSVIAGAMTPEQVTSNAKASSWAMTLEERDAIDAIAAWDGTGAEIEGFGGGSSSVQRR
jgi:aryl-alcohol dehydrogenase-like predicted oxidoreductase